MTDLLAATRRALAGRAAWLVGGAVRDRLLGRPADLDLDLAVDGDVRAAARAVARATRGTPFELSGEHGAWRVTGDGWQVDVVALQGAAIEDDLALRDLTVNAMAQPLAGGELVDPHGGAADLDARRLRMVTPEAFDRDPLRAVRVARLATTLAFDVDPATVAAARARAGDVSAVAQERVFAELRLLVGDDDALRGLALLDDLALTPVVLPELDALRGVEQSVYHHRDVHGHTLEVLEAVIALQRDPAAVLGPQRAARVAAFLAEALSDGLTRGGALRWAALLHDAAKPATRVELADGGIGFPGHDRVGAALAREALTRLRASERLRAHVAAITLHHLRLGFLVHDEPLDRRAIHRYLVATAPVEADVTLLTVADRVATRGRKADEAIARHVALAGRLLDAALDRRTAAPTRPLVRGDELARALGVRPGPRLGELLAEIEEARYAGELATAEEAVALARRALGAGDADPASAPRRGGGEPRRGR